jgi:hypothetical protein
MRHPRREATVLAIGCFTKSWHRNLVIEPGVHRQIDGDGSLTQLLQKKLVEHGESLPPMLPRGDLRTTVAWHSRSPRGRSVVITTGCDRNARIATHVYTLRTKGRS